MARSNKQKNIASSSRIKHPGKHGVNLGDQGANQEANSCTMVDD